VNQNQQTIFLETSIQIQRVLSTTNNDVGIETVLKNPFVKAVSSSYVWMEYQRAIVADYAHVHRLMGRYKDWGSLFEHILDGSRAFRPRSAVRCTQIVGQLYRLTSQSYEYGRQFLDMRQFMI
jgi:hypothetical protein